MDAILIVMIKMQIVVIRFTDVVVVLSGMKDDPL